MSDLDERQDHLVRLLAPRYQVSPSAGEPTGPAAEDLLMGIMHSSPAPVEVPSQARRRPLFTWRRLAFGVPVAAGVAALALAITAFLPTSGPAGPAAAQADSLEIAQQNGYLVVKIVDPVADPQRYRAELAKHGLDIELTLAPAEPDQVGKVIFQEIGASTGSKLEVVEAPGQCAANGNCAVAIRVPMNFPSYAHIVIGRTPRPGEQITGDAPVLSQAEKDRLRALIGKPVAEARTALAALGLTIEYRVGGDSHAATADQVPGTWIVFDVAPLSTRSVALWSSPTGTPPSPAPAKIG